MSTTEIDDTRLYLTVKEAAAVAKRSENALYLLRYETKRTGVQHGPRWRKIDGRLLVARADLLAWLAGADDPAA